MHTPDWKQRLSDALYKAGVPFLEILPGPPLTVVYSAQATAAQIAAGQTLVAAFAPSAGKAAEPTPTHEAKS